MLITSPAVAVHARSDLIRPAIHTVYTTVGNVAISYTCKVLNIEHTCNYYVVPSLVPWLLPLVRNYEFKGHAIIVHKGRSLGTRLEAKGNKHVIILGLYHPNTCEIC